MSDSNNSWRDLTVDDAIATSDFYVAVLGWSKEPLAMDGYDDYIMKDSQGNVMGGICHRKGSNVSVPAGWMTYFTTDDFDASLSKAESLGAKKLTEVRQHGEAKFVYLQDPAGAHFALYGNTP